MEAKDAINLNLITTSLSATTKDEAIKTLSNLLESQGKITDVTGFIADVYKREVEGQTGIGSFVAIPHGKSEYVTIPSVAIGINDHEIPWETPDGKGVRVVILFAVGSDMEGSKNHLKILSLFARKLGNDLVIERLLSAKDADAVMEAFS